MLTRSIRAALAFCFAATFAYSADTVELLPGKITGAISLSSETVNSGTVYANATDGSGSASSSFSGGTYSIVVPAGKTWRLNLNVNVGGNSNLSINTAETIAVGPNETVTQDYTIATARLTADVQVANGTLSSFGYLQTSGNNGTVSFYSYAYNQSYVTVLPFNGVSISGTATLLSDANQSSTVALSTQSIDVSSSGATATWNVDAAFVSSTIQGALQLSGGPTLSSAQLYLSGPNGSYNYVNLAGNGSTFQFDNLQAGSYYAYAYANFTGSSLYMNRNISLSAGSVETVNFAYDLATATVPLNLTGFVTAAPNVGATLYGVGPDNVSGNAGLDNGSFKQVVTAGSWSFSQLNVSSWEPNGYFSLYKYDANSPSATFAAGDSLTVAPVSLDTTQTEFTFDVVEAPGAASETLISYPRISGYTYRYDSNGSYIGYSSVYAQSYAYDQSKPVVRVVGEPGTYYLQAYGRVDGSDVSFGNFTLELKAPLPTPVGTEVSVTPGAGVTLEFDQVTTSGVTTVSQLPVGPALPPGYSNLTSNGAKIYYSASTTATFSGYIDVSIAFDPTTVPAELEGDLHLFYYDKATETWIDITTSVDQAGNLITGTAPGLSTFAIGLPHAPTIDSLTAPASISTDTPVTFTATFSDADLNDIHTAEWSWGGAGSSTGIVNEANRTITVTKSFASGGQFNGSLTLTDATGNVATRTFAYTVSGGASDTVAPVIVVPANLTVEATSIAGAEVSFSVSASDDQDGPVAVTLSAASGSTFALGSTTVTATASDRAGNRASATFTVTVVDTIAPALTAPANLVLEATSAAGASASFAATATDATGVTLSYSHASGSTFALGTTTVTVTAVDAVGNRSTATFTVTVRDTTAPVFTALSTNAPTLWPPNHKMVAVTVSAATTDASAVSYRITRVTSNEPDNGLGDGDTANDIKITGAMTVDLRAERAAKGTGRVYTITVEAKDAAGNVSTKTVTVGVPLNQSGK
jgi:hypothetical protein